ncbi:CaiB/BaiF CoA transferase family protein [Aquamicrobium zhengzhouense]|uniref:CoA transferase n=1 Tax=Aquamicrobium zhengzhouense TaxID=2781738 RepID=A0ABS0SGI4_9HYPH|nr:CoA transferase [Aquamicrobium zhengzhouense]MBI1622414.1 CoA transferase [Aquamicrobium zhengzhouense]
MSGNSTLGSEAIATGPLAGVRVLDLTTVIMGPAATQILGDLGADVIKIESPGGDSMRYIGPAHHESMGPLFIQSNRNKRSVVLDLKSKEGREALLSLVPDADILVYNVRPQAMKRLGIDYETLSAINPKIIFCGAVGYGSEGPNSGQAVYDDLMQAASGISGLFEAVDGAPRYAPVNICDRVVGLYLTIALTSALYNRSVTGKGQEIEVPMFETMAQFVVADHMGGRAFEPNIGAMGYKRLLSRVRGPYKTKDGYLSLVVYLDKHWHAFCELVGDPGMIERDPRFATQELRTQNAELAGQYLAEHLPSRTNAEWIEFCRSIDIPVAGVNSIEDLFEDPHLKAVGLFEQAEHPSEGTINYARFPIKFSSSPASIRRLAPNLGEHTEEVLGFVPSRDSAAN